MVAATGVARIKASHDSQRGVSLGNVRDFYDRSDGVLIGKTDFKVDGVWGGRSDARAYAEAARICRG